MKFHKIKSFAKVNLTLKILNKYCSFRKGDRSLSAEIESIADIISSGKLAKAVLKQIILE